VTPVPQLTQVQLAGVVDRIRQDGTLDPVLLDHTSVVDEQARKRICKGLGMVCPPFLLSVDDITAKRLLVTLALARRDVGRDTYRKHDMLLWLWQYHSVPTTDMVVQSRTYVTNLVNADLAMLRQKPMGESLVQRAVQWLNFTPEQKNEVISGRRTITSYTDPRSSEGAKRVRPPRSGKPSPPRSRPAAGADEKARHRMERAQIEYEGMVQAPWGGQNNFFTRRAFEVQERLDDIFEIPPAKAASHVPLHSLPHFLVDRGEWWAEFTRLCYERWQAEAPQLPKFTPMRFGPLNERDLTGRDRDVLAHLRTLTEPVTAVEVAVVFKLNESYIRQSMGRLVDAGLVEVAGQVESRGSYRAVVEPE
jgi:hypothetical protein